MKTLKITNKSCENCIYNDSNNCMMYSVTATILINGKRTKKGASIKVENNWSCHLFEMK